jgi:hypothetical protein
MASDEGNRLPSAEVLAAETAEFIRNKEAYTAVIDSGESDFYGVIRRAFYDGYLAGSRADNEVCIHPGVFSDGQPTTHCNSCGRDVPMERL